MYPWAEEERLKTLTTLLVLLTPALIVFKDYMTGETIYQYPTRDYISKWYLTKERKKNQFLCDSLRLLFYLKIILYISFTVVNQNTQFFFALWRLSTEMWMTLSTFMYNLFVFCFFETMFMWLFPVNCSLWQ